MSYLSLPELVAILSMAIVLTRLKRRQDNELLPLWITGLGLIVVEGVARIFYLMPLSATLHTVMHVVALDTYFLAGVAFFRSATGRLRVLHSSRLHLTVCAVPYLLLLTVYGANVRDRGVYVALAALGLASSIAAATLVKPSNLSVLYHALLWVPAAMAVWLGQFRLASYYGLFVVYSATAIAFYFLLPRFRWGRAMIVGGFGLWAICFLSHPWLADWHKGWLPMAERVWDLQKFFVTFGLMLSALEEHSATNKYYALHDGLTGLPNRKLLRDRLQQSMALARRNGTRLLIFNIDLNHFKQVNDLAGHEVGDDLLCEVARRLGRVTRTSDTLARVGGDEFILLVSDLHLCTEGEALRQDLEALRDVFRDAVELGPWEYRENGEARKLEPRLSIGGAVYPDEAVDARELLRLADARMYEDKRIRQGLEALEELLPAGWEELGLAG